jgi:GMP synthase (glutamine-hydrolysing)
LSVKRSLVVLKAGSTFADIVEKHGDFEDWVEGGLELPKGRIRVIDVPSGEPLPGSDSIAAVVVTGAHEMVTDGAPWSDASAEWLRGLVAERVPVLGICYGHQLLARALGGEVGYHPRGREVGAVTVSCNSEGREDALLGILPTSFPAYSSHSQSVLELPPDAVRLASTDFDSNHAFRVGERAWGVQFHPEFSEAVMRCYVGKQREELAKQGQDADQISRDVQPSPAGRLLQRFGRMAFSSLAR